MAICTVPEGRCPCGTSCRSSNNAHYAAPDVKGTRDSGVEEPDEKPRAAAGSDQKEAQRAQRARIGRRLKEIFVASGTNIASIIWSKKKIKGGGEPLQKIKLAVPTKGDKGLKEAVSEVFGRAKTFTVVEISDGSIGSVQVVENPAVSYKHGAGPIVVKTLVDMGVTVVAAREFGPGASALLEQNNVKIVRVKPGMKVAEVIEDMLK